MSNLTTKFELVNDYLRIVEITASLKPSRNGRRKAAVSSLAEAAHSRHLIWAAEKLPFVAEFRRGHCQVGNKSVRSWVMTIWGCGR
jgi:hypothetical protein